MKAAKLLIAIPAVIIIVLSACDKKENSIDPDLTGTIWVCDTNYSGIDYYYRITFTSGSEFDYYENGLLEMEEVGTYSYTPPRIDITVWGFTIEGSIEGNKLYYPTISAGDIDPITRVFTKQ